MYIVYTDQKANLFCARFCFVCTSPFCHSETTSHRQGERRGTVAGSRRDDEARSPAVGETERRGTAARETTRHGRGSGRDDEAQVLYIPVVWRSHTHERQAPRAWVRVYHLSYPTSPVFVLHWLVQPYRTLAYILPQPPTPFFVLHWIVQPSFLLLPRPTTTFFGQHGLFHPTTPTTIFCVLHWSSVGRHR